MENLQIRKSREVMSERKEVSALWRSARLLLVISQSLEEKELQLEEELHQFEEAYNLNPKNKECRETIRQWPTYSTTTMRNLSMLKVVFAQNQKCKLNM